MDDKELELYPLPHLPDHRRRALGGSRSEWPICVATADKYLSGALDAAGFASDDELLAGGGGGSHAIPNGSRGVEEGPAQWTEKAEARDGHFARTLHIEEVRWRAMF